MRAEWIAPEADHVLYWNGKFAEHYANLKMHCDFYSRKLSPDVFENFMSFLSTEERGLCVELNVEGMPILEIVESIPRFKERCIVWLQERMASALATSAVRIDSARDRFLKLNSITESDSSPQ